MTQQFKRIFSASAVALFLCACSTPATSDMAKADAKPDPRQGAAVRNICFNSQIRNWRTNDNHSVIVEKGVKDEYKLDLIGACNPQDAFTSIGLVSRVGGGSCLETGDHLVTDSRYDGDCSIQRIYEWHKDADKAQSTAPPAAS